MNYPREKLYNLDQAKELFRKEAILMHGDAVPTSRVEELFYPEIITDVVMSKVKYAMDSCGLDHGTVGLTYDGFIRAVSLYNARILDEARKGHAAGATDEGKTKKSTQKTGGKE